MKEKEQAEQPQQPPKQAQPKISDQDGSTNGIPNWWIDNYTDGSGNCYSDADPGL